MWAPLQSPIGCATVWKITSILRLKTLPLMLRCWGAFGRKSKPDFCCGGAFSKRNGFAHQSLWTRRCDLTNDFFHAVSVQNVRVAFDKEQKVTGWYHRSAFPPIGGTTTNEKKLNSAGETQLGLVDFPYDIPNIQCESITAKAKTRIGWLRSRWATFKQGLLLEACWMRLHLIVVLIRLPI